jgi:hypothetical protein
VQDGVDTTRKLVRFRNQCSHLIVERSRAFRGNQRFHRSNVHKRMYTGLLAGSRRGVENRTARQPPYAAVAGLDRRTRPIADVQARRLNGRSWPKADSGFGGSQGKGRHEFIGSSMAGRLARRRAPARS